MNSKIFFVLILIIAGVAVFGMMAKSKAEKAPQKVSANVQTGEQASKFAIQSKTMGAVEIEAKPVSLETGKDFVFEISINTHSVELNYDYTQIATLTDDLGNSYKPTKWTGGSSGHHVSGQLIFTPLTGNPKELTLTLSGVDNKTEDFNWQL